MCSILLLCKSKSIQRLRLFLKGAELPGRERKKPTRKKECLSFLTPLTGVRGVVYYVYYVYVVYIQECWSTLVYTQHCSAVCSIGAGAPILPTLLRRVGACAHVCEGPVRACMSRAHWALTIKDCLIWSYSLPYYVGLFLMTSKLV